MSHPLLSWRIHSCGNPLAWTEDWKRVGGDQFVIVPFDTTCSPVVKAQGKLYVLSFWYQSRPPFPRTFKSMFFDITKLLPPVTSSSSPWLLHLLLFLTLIFVYYSPLRALKVTGKSFHFIADNCRKGKGRCSKKLVRCNKRKVRETRSFFRSDPTKSHGLCSTRSLTFIPSVSREIVIVLNDSRYDCSSCSVTALPAGVTHISTYLTCTLWLTDIMYEVEKFITHLLYCRY